MRIDLSCHSQSRCTAMVYAILFLVVVPFAGQLHVEMEGVVTSINFDTLGDAYSDSVGLKIGSKVDFSVDLDYAASPVLYFDGIADTLPNLDYPYQSDTSGSTRNFRLSFSGTRFAQGLFSTPSRVLGDHGVIQRSPGLPTQIELSSNRQWNDSVSWVDLTFPTPDGELTNGSQGMGQEELLIARTTRRDAATLLVCAYDITRITISPSVSLIRPSPDQDSRRPARRPMDREWGSLRLNRGWFSITGRRQ